MIKICLLWSSNMLAHLMVRWYIRQQYLNKVGYKVIHFLFQRLSLYSRLIRADKPIGTLLLMWPMVIALLVAGNGHPKPEIVFIFLIGCFLMRSCGCAINDFADRHVDGHVQRTKHRPLAQGLIHPMEAVGVYCICAGLSFALVLRTNIETIGLAFIGLLLATIYPFLKRITHGPQWFLGAAFAWAIPMSYMAELQYMPHHAWILYAATVLWAFAYDTEYALVDMRDDKKIGVKSTAIWLGDKANLSIVFAQLCVSALILIYAYASGLFGISIIMAVGIGLILIAYQFILIRRHEPAKCFKAFLNNQWLGGVWFLGFVFELRF